MPRSALGWWAKLLLRWFPIGTYLLSGGVGPDGADGMGDRRERAMNGTAESSNDW